MLMHDALEYLAHGRIACRTSFLNPSVAPFNLQQRDIESQVRETSTAATETPKEIGNNIKNKTTKEEKEPTNWKERTIKRMHAVIA